jgi:hypothetical protein
MIKQSVKYIQNHLQLFVLSLPLLLVLGFNPGERDVDKLFGRDHNVCKKLYGKVLFYMVFVETGDSSPWTDFDLNSTVDSVKIAINWLNETAKKNGKDLQINFNTQVDDSLKIIKQKLGGQFIDLIETKDGLDKIDKWTNKIIKIKTGEKNRLKLITKLRNEFAVESIALVFMVNYYYKEDFIFSFNTTNNDDIEYSIINSKKPNLIAQDILNLFGAPYLYYHPSTVNKRDTKQLNKIFYNDVMANTNADLRKLEIGEITRYFIGWTDTLNEEYEKMVKEKPKI